MKAKSYYQQLKPIVLPYLEAYKDDFLKYDRECLTKKKPERFILCFRNTGTDFVHLDKWDEMTREDIDDNYDLVRTSIFPRNDRFILGEKGGIRELTLGEAIAELQRIANIAKDIRQICYQCGTDFHTLSGVYHEFTGTYFCCYHCKEKTVAAANAEVTV